MTRPPHPITALVVAEDEVTRVGLRLLLQNIVRIRDVGEARGRYDVLKLAESTGYDLAVVDLCRADLARSDNTIDDLAERWPDTRVVVYTDDAQAGLSYCLGKRLRCACAVRGPDSLSQLTLSIKRLMDGAGDGGQRRAGAGDDTRSVAALTNRERQILSLVAAGEGSKRIATSLGVSLRTIESHRASICTKLGVKTVAELTKIALKAGFTSLDQ